MTHDPYQTYQTLAAFPGMTNPVLGNPFSSPYTAMQTSAINPAAAYNPFAVQQLAAQGIQGIPGLANYGTVPLQQQWPGVSSFMGWQNPFAGVFQNPIGSIGLQNPLLVAAMQNPSLAYALQAQNPLLNPVLAQLASQVGAQIGYQRYSPFQQPYQQHHQQIGHALAALGQQVSPFAQFGSPVGQFGSPLAPQSWVGQGIAGQIGQIGGGYGQGNPLLAQLAARALQGVSPWAAF